MKRLALAWLLERGCAAAAIEVRCPISRFRVDAAGYLDSEPAPPVHPRPATLFDPGVSPEESARPRRIRCEPRTIVIECKQSRADFLRDRREAGRLLALRERLERRARFLEQHRIRHEEPHLRRSGSLLFADGEVWDFGESRLATYRATLRRIERIDEQLYGETKFCTVARYRLADRLYILAPRGMIKPGETPPGWGLLECPRRWLEAPDAEFDPRLAPAALRATRESPDHASRPERRLRFLRNIAVAATRASISVRTNRDAPPDVSARAQSS